MGVYETLRAAVRSDRPEYSYECLSCGARFAVEHYTCPECGGFSVEAHVHALLHGGE